MTRVLLLGMMATGKTTVGRAIAARTGWPYVDNDELVEQASGLATHELLARRGEKALRRAESGVLTTLLAMPEPLVAGVPGGVVLDPVDRARLRAGSAHVVWLRAEVATLVRRVGAGAGRPWLGDDPADALAQLAAVREPFYAEVADQVVDVDALPADRVAALVLDAAQPRTAGGQPQQRQ
jgi:shikimate kinase